MADGFRAEKLQRALLRNLSAANQIFNAKYSWQAMVQHRHNAKMRAAFLAIKAKWEQLAVMRSRLPTASSFYPICMMILPKLSRTLLQSELTTSDNLLAKNFERQL